MFQSSALLLFHYNCYSTATGISGATITNNRTRKHFGACISCSLAIRGSNN